jgi:imidazolonepropionase-like amidohydrolase
LGAAGEAGSWLAEPLAGAEAFARAARQRIAQGRGVIKLFATGLLDTSQAGQVLHPLALKDQEVAAAVAAAHKAGLRVAVHASGEAAINQALEQGVDCLEHGFFLSRGTLAKMAARGAWWSPTLAPVMAHAADPQGRHDPAVRRVWAEITQRQMAQVKLGAELGVKLVLGSDAGSYGVPHGQGAFMEMAAWLEAGVPPATVFAAATRRAALVLGLQGELGGIFVGARAWLLGTRSDPRLDPMQLARPVWRGF